MSLKGKRIFYIEDDVNNFVLVKMVMERAGVTVGFERWGGLQTIMKLRAFAPLDLVLLDLMLPNQVSGYGVFESIRADAALAEVPVIIVSAADADTEIPKARRLGLNGYIAKPIDVWTFPQHIEAFFDGQPVWLAE